MATRLIAFEGIHDGSGGHSSSSSSSASAYAPLGRRFAGGHRRKYGRARRAAPQRTEGSFDIAAGAAARNAVIPRRVATRVDARQAT